MRKNVCTATVCLSMMGAAVALFVIQVPQHVWWTGELDLNSGKAETLAAWIFDNVLALPFMVVMTGLVLVGFWHAASYLCGKLRGER